MYVITRQLKHIHCIFIYNLFLLNIKWAADEDGEHVFCFSNEFSTFTHKVVYMDLMVGEEKPLTKNIESHHTALTQVLKFSFFLLL